MGRFLLSLLCSLLCSFWIVSCPVLLINEISKPISIELNFSMDRRSTWVWFVDELLHCAGVSSILCVCQVSFNLLLLVNYACVGWGSVAAHGVGMCMYVSASLFVHLCLPVHSCTLVFAISNASSVAPSV